MYLKRLYDDAAVAAWEAAGRPQSSKPAVKGIKVLRAGPEQHLSPRFIEGGLGEGWLKIARGCVLIAGQDGEVAYRIVRPPGLYCCHCEKRLEDGGTAQAHVAATHDGVRSPDPGAPGGYRRDNYYDCVKEP
jgi:hypothetical protein